jgi:hypothetical protein
MIRKTLKFSLQNVESIISISKRAHECPSVGHLRPMEGDCASADTL